MFETLQGQYELNPCRDCIDGNHLQPIFEYPRTKYSAERVLKILLDPNISPSKVCQERPVNITKSSTFVIDITKLDHEKDVLKDGFGKWNYSGSHPIPYRVKCFPEGNVEAERCYPGASGQDVVQLRRLHATHPSNSNFKRMIAFISGTAMVNELCFNYWFLIRIVKVTAGDNNYVIQIGAIQHCPHQHNDT